ncbi:MAG: hypothetical protein FJX57_23740, partial [Alphaproteobacteria bacterium]|nr:hypothetical protein [Alphaproteobacteria bacterium]
MKITAVRARVLLLPIRHKSLLGVGALEHVENVLVTVETDAGITGYGEASPWPCFAENAWSIKAAIDHYLGPSIIGQDPGDIERLLLHMDGVLHDYSFAKAAIDIALWDIAGKALSKPVYALLGGKVRGHTTLSYSIANQDIRADLDEIKWLIDQGFFVFKIKAGVLELDAELPRIEAIRKLLAPPFDMRIDFNQGLRR